MSKAILHHGDCLTILPTFDPESIDTCITDPPYGLKFMGKDWDNGIPGKAYWEAVFDVLKPGGMCLAFGGTRTFHRLMCAIEDAGFQLRDTIMWVYGSGFPKSHNISKAIDKAAGAEREVVGAKRAGSKARHGHKGDRAIMPFECETINLDVTAPATPEAKLWDGWGTALKPAWEPIIVAMKPIEGTYANNALIHGVAGLNVDGGRVEGNKPSVPQAAGGTGKVYGFKNGKGRSGIMSDNTKGRWPANLIHDGSEEVVGLFPVTGASKAVRRNQVARTAKSKEAEKARTGMLGHNDNGGSAARFFYQAKATKKDRGEGNTHPTVKPSSLMDYLCRLTATPTGGVVLDPFAGSGSTGVACVRTGRDFIGCEIDSDYCEIAKGRLGI